MKKSDDPVQQKQDANSPLSDNCMYTCKFVSL